MARAKKILAQNAEGHHRIAELLIEKEVITAEDVESILGPRPWKSRQDEIIEDNEAMLQEEKAKEQSQPVSPSEENKVQTDSPSDSAPENGQHDSEEPRKQ